MAPALMPGRIIVARRATSIKPGDMVVFAHQGVDKIKRVSKIERGKIFVTGDNLAVSTDSRDFGWLESADIIAKVVWPRTVA